MPFNALQTRLGTGDVIFVLSPIFIDRRLRALRFELSDLIHHGGELIR